jgi:hypothetical protein
MAPWSQLAPPSPVREVEAARKRVLELRGQVDSCGQARDDARASVVAAERSDREAMAAALARGEAATSDVQLVERASAAAAAATRQFEALQLAIANAESELGAVVAKHRSQWAKRAAGEVTASRSDAQRALEAFRVAVARHQDALQVSEWLATGLDRNPPGQVTPGLLGDLGPASARWAANQSPVTAGVVFGWFGEALAEPEPQPQTQPARSEPVTAAG